jgi:hypothetical protein
MAFMQKVCMMNLMKTWIRNAIILLLLAIVSLDGCASSAATQDEVVIVYTRIGGYAGFNEQHTIFLGGRIAAKDGREWQVAPHEVEVLLQKIEKLGFYRLAADYKPKNTCCDRISFELNVNFGSHTNTVRAVTGAPGAPDQLWEILGLVQKFLEK